VRSSGPIADAYIPPQSDVRGGQANSSRIEIEFLNRWGECGALQ
jgi:hypothetical protein